MIQPVQPPGDVIAFPVKSSDEVLEHVSASSIKDYLTCSLRFYFKRVLGLPEPVSPNLHLGQAVHAGIQARWRGGDHSPDAVIEQYRLSFASLEDEGDVRFDEGERDKSLEKGEAVLRAYLESDHAQADERPLGVEVQLREDIPELASPLVGYVDLVRPGHVPVDYKTCAATPNLELEAFLHELQLTAYQILIESATGEEVMGRELVFLVKTKTPKVIVHRLPPASASDVARFRAMAGAMIDGVYHERWTPQPGMHCAWCSYRRQCAQWTGGLDESG